MSKKRRDYLRHTRRIQAEGQGVFKIELVPQYDVPDLFLASVGGDVAAMRTADLIIQFLKMIAAARPPPLCLLCDNELSVAALPRTIVILTPQRDDPSMAILNGLCAACAGKPELEAAVLAKYRECLIPDLRRLPPFSRPGQA